MSVAKPWMPAAAGAADVPGALRACPAWRSRTRSSTSPRPPAAAAARRTASRAIAITRMRYRARCMVGSPHGFQWLACRGGRRSSSARRRSSRSVARSPSVARTERDHLGGARAAGSPSRCTVCRRSTPSPVSTSTQPSAAERPTTRPGTRPAQRRGDSAGRRPPDHQRAGVEVGERAREGIGQRAHERVHVRGRAVPVDLPVRGHARARVGRRASSCATPGSPSRWRSTAAPEVQPLQLRSAGRTDR